MYNISTKCNSFNASVSRKFLSGEVTADCQRRARTRSLKTGKVTGFSSYIITIKGFMDEKIT